MNAEKLCTEEKKALLIVNPVSGRKTVQRYLAQIVRCLMDKGYLVTTAVTAARGEARELSARLGPHVQLLVCAGGDGTLNECVSGLADADAQTPVGYIPCGSTNDFAATHGLSMDILTAAKNVAEGRQRRFDLGCFGERYFMHLALFGAFTWMAYSTDQEQKNVLGYGAYVLDALKDLKKVKPIRLRLISEHKILEGEYLFGAISTDRHVAGIFELPEEQIEPDDGRLAAVLLRAPKNVLEWDALAHCLLNGDTSAPVLDVVTGECFRVESEELTEWSLDGESSGLCPGAQIQTVPSFLTLQG